MTAITFDTLAYSKKLKAVGVPAEQADVQAEALAEIIDEKLATKRDLKELEAKLTYKLTIRLGSMIIGSFIATVTTLGFLMGWMLKEIH
jgi:hypothetical protein